jgi:nucleoside 2-deoxyribosyltransferase
MKKIYVACSLTHATQEFRDSIEVLKEHIGKKYELLSFLGLAAGTAKEVFDYDITCVKNADFIVADCTYPSIGMGIELGYAYSLNIPVLLIAKIEAKVALMALGLPNKVTDLVRYEHILDVLPEVDLHLRAIH